MRVITLGTFDLMHYGHLKLLQRCKELGEVVVGLNTDDFVFRYKHFYPIMNYSERETSLYATNLVHSVIPNEQKGGSAKWIIDESRANAIVIGSDWGRKDYLAQLGITWEWLEAKGIYLCYVPYTKEISSTEIKQRCLQSGSLLTH